MADERIRVKVQLVEDITSRTAAMRRELQRIKKNIETLGSSGSKSVGQVETAFKAAAIAAAGFLGAKTLQHLKRFASESISAFKDLQEAQNAVEVQFGRGANVIKSFADSAARNVGLASSSFQQMSQVTGAIIKNFIDDETEAARATIKLTQRASDLASVFNTDVNDALFAIQAGLRRMPRPLRRYGVLLNDIDVRQRAVALGMAETTKQVSNQAHGLAALDIIYEQTEKVAGDFQRTSNDIANSQRILAAEWENQKALIGADLAPAYADLLDIGHALIPVTDGLGSAGAALGSAFAAMVPAIKAAAFGLGEVVDHAGRGALSLFAMAGSLDAISRIRVHEALDNMTGSTQRLAEAQQAVVDAGSDVTRELLTLLDIRLVAATDDFANSVAHLGVQHSDHIRLLRTAIPLFAQFQDAVMNVTGGQRDYATELREVARTSGLSFAEQNRAYKTLLDNATNLPEGLVAALRDATLETELMLGTTGSDLEAVIDRWDLYAEAVERGVAANKGFFERPVGDLRQPFREVLGTTITSAVSVFGPGPLRDKPEPSVFFDPEAYTAEQNAADDLAESFNFLGVSFSGTVGGFIAARKEFLARGPVFGESVRNIDSLDAAMKRLGPRIPNQARAARNAAAAWDLYEDQIRSAHRAVAEAADPALALIGAVQREAAARERLNDVVKDSESTMADREEAALDLLVATQNVGVAEANMAMQTEEVIAAFFDLARESELATELVDALADALEAFDGTKVEGEIVLKATVPGIAKGITTPDVVFDVGGGFKAAQHGATNISAGDVMRVGEAGTELFVPHSPGSIIPAGDFGNTTVQVFMETTGDAFNDVALALAMSGITETVEAGTTLRGT